MCDFKDLAVWRKSRRLVLEVYRAASAFPPDERVGLTAQLGRSVASVPTNIVVCVPSVADG